MKAPVFAENRLKLDLCSGYSLGLKIKTGYWDIKGFMSLAIECNTLCSNGVVHIKVSMFPIEKCRSLCPGSRLPHSKPWLNHLDNLALVDLSAVPKASHSDTLVYVLQEVKIPNFGQSTCIGVVFLPSRF